MFEMRTARYLSLTAAIGLSAILGSCSSPVPPASQGSASVMLGKSSSASATCPSGGTINIPYDASKSGPTTTGSGRPAPAIDGEGGQTVACKVKPNGSLYEVTGTLYSPGNGATVELAVVIAAGGENVPGAVTVTDGPNRLEIDKVNALSTCEFTVKAGAGESLSIAPGRVWGKVTCANLGILNSPSDVCNLSNGFFILENCDQ
jgi:hypothetical protein